MRDEQTLLHPRGLFKTLRAVSRQPVVYAEIPGAQHAFEIFPSLRSALAIDGVERFLFVIYSEHLRRHEGQAKERRVSAAR